MVSEPRALHLHFALGIANYILCCLDDHLEILWVWPLPRDRCRGRGCVLEVQGGGGGGGGKEE